MKDITDQINNERIDKEEIIVVMMGEEFILTKELSNAFNEFSRWFKIDNVQDLINNYYILLQSKEIPDSFVYEFFDKLIELNGFNEQGFFNIPEDNEKIISAYESPRASRKPNNNTIVLDNIRIKGPYNFKEEKSFSLCTFYIYDESFEKGIFSEFFYEEPSYVKGEETGKEKLEMIMKASPTDTFDIRGYALKKTEYGEKAIAITNISRYNGGRSVKNLPPIDKDVKVYG